MVRIAFNTVRGESGQEHCEVTGRMPSINSILQSALTGTADLAQLMTQAKADLHILANFCEALAAAI